MYETGFFLSEGEVHIFKKLGTFWMFGASDWLLSPSEVSKFKNKCLPKRHRNELKNSVFENTSPLLSTSIPVQLRTAICMFACYSMLLKSIYLFILFDYVSTLSKAHNSISIWALIWPTPDLIFLNVEELYWSQNLKWWKFYNVKHIMYGYSNLS